MHQIHDFSWIIIRWEDSDTVTRDVGMLGDSFPDVLRPAKLGQQVDIQNQNL